MNSQTLSFSILLKLRPKLTSFPRSNTANLQLAPPPQIAPILFPMSIIIWKIAIPLYYNILFFSYYSLNGNMMGKPQYKQLLNIKYH